MMFSAILSFLGGSVFRMLWGEISSFVDKKQDYAHEIEMARLQSDLDDKRSDRTMASMKLQSELGIQQVEVQSDAATNQGAADAFTAAMQNAFKPTGIWFVDVWNGVIRPSFATICLVLWLGKVMTQGWKMDEWDMSLAAGIIGFFFADRGLGKRGK